MSGRDAVNGKNFRTGIVRLAYGSMVIVLFFAMAIAPPQASAIKLHSIVTIKPTFTIAAYQPRGFYDYYRNTCSTRCLTVRLRPAQYTSDMDYAGSSNALKKIESLGISDVVTDEQVTKNPSILASYEKVIVLHNEYVTQAEFDAITRHPDVLYLYPNALYALVSYNPVSNTITLQKGHGYKGVNDAFNWPPSRSTKDEYNTSCKNWQFEKASNGSVLDCYPEFDILHDAKLMSLVAG
ncbi:hypothetical protein NTE_02045 [Candidatus Nitrososphaera evergladensis SR1]|uniref:N,N-dimethylformamidase beta subunit-like C-terminal domain-containing protein n=1 Tax=Candidatus Nitrososphaera evergladensis SR1 TaxID=1459636 RepID=A0A075MTJ4_9ARCH|nr:hypothetical protein [Candidatus Nitrososphaera evergladensis]AIF84102.1 hypothetical protein NTE_02045 [Candidatus Nitrososphaera evergladensis SR1]